MYFHEKLKDLRKKYRYTQSQLAKALNYHGSTICNYEKGKNEPKINDLIKLAKFFNITVDYLIGLSDCKNEGNTHD